MEIDPYRQFLLLFSAPLAGFLFGGVWEILALSRVLLGAYRVPDGMRALYAHPLPLLGRPVVLREKSTRRLWRGLIIGAGDFLFCILFGGTVCVLLYCLNDGAIRISVPVLALCGFAAFRRLLGARLERLRDYLAYACAAVACYARRLLALPFLLLKRVLTLLVFRPVRALFARWVGFVYKKRTEQLCQKQLALAANGLEDLRGRACPEKNKKKKGNGYEKNEKVA